MIYVVDFSHMRVSASVAGATATANPLPRNVRVPKMGVENDGATWQLISKSSAWAT